MSEKAKKKRKSILCFPVAARAGKLQRICRPSISRLPLSPDRFPLFPAQREYFDPRLQAMETIEAAWIVGGRSLKSQTRRANQKSSLSKWEGLPISGEGKWAELEGV